MLSLPSCHFHVFRCPQSTLQSLHLSGTSCAVRQVRSASEAIDVINAREKPLVLHLYSTDDHVLHRFLHETSSGALLRNDCLMHVGAILLYRLVVALPTRVSSRRRLCLLHVC